MKQKRIVLISVCSGLLSLYSISFSQNISDLTRRVEILEQKVTELEKRLNLTQNSSKYTTAQTDINVSSSSNSNPSSGLAFLRIPVSAELFQKSIKFAESEGASNQLALLITFKNNGQQGITAFKGEVIFKTVYGDSLMSFKVDIEKYLPPLKGASWLGGFPYDQTSMAQKKLLDMKLSELTTQIRITEVYFEDGSRKTIQNQ